MRTTTATLALLGAVGSAAARGGSNLVNPCLDATKPYAKMPFCDIKLVSGRPPEPCKCMF